MSVFSDKRFSPVIFWFLAGAYAFSASPAFAFNRYIRRFLNQYSELGFGLIAFVLTVALMPVYICLVRKRNLKQFVREEGPQSHSAKTGTPTTGGVCFILVIIALGMSWLFYSKQFVVYPRPHTLATIAVLITALLCGVLGLIDDLAKIKGKTNKGISARTRLVLEALIGGAAAYILASLSESPVVMPLFQGTGTTINYALPLAWFVGIGSFLVAATTNAINLHDGMDGLAAGTTASVFTTLAVFLSLLGNTNLAVLAAIAAGAMCGFLMYNHYPARIFMGDTGSLFIGGLMAMITLSGGLLFWFTLMAVIYIAETVSVIMQVVWFKLTKAYVPEKPTSFVSLIWLKLTKRLPGEGKRLFRMAPLHHHFEAVFRDKKIAEWQVVAGFWFTQVAICFVVLILFFKL